MTIDSNNPLCALCALCTNFTKDIQQDPHGLPTLPRADAAEWHDSMTIWHSVSKHHASLADLVTSATTCALCRLFHNDLQRLADTTNTSLAEYGQGWLGLYSRGSNAYTASSGGLQVSRGDVFRAGFSGSVDRMPGRKAPLVNPPLMYRLCRCYSPRGDGGVGVAAECPLQARSYGMEASWAARRIPEDGTSMEVFAMANEWLTECIKNHAECREHSLSTNTSSSIEKPVGGGNGVKAGGPLPTRVLDTEPGSGDGNRVKLHVSGRKAAPYVALSHCWGGNIPNKTIKATLPQLQQGLQVSSLPQNFQDAILITRHLGLRSGRSKPAPTASSPPWATASSTSAPGVSKSDSSRHDSCTLATTRSFGSAVSPWLRRTTGRGTGPGPRSR